MPALNFSHEKPIQNQRQFRMLEQKKLLETYHALAHFGSTAALSFISRLLNHLTQQARASHFHLNQYRVLAGGKVQIDVRCKMRAGEESLFIKLPLVSFAETRLRKQSETLQYLHRHASLRQPNFAALNSSKVFPKILAQGKFEQQAYFFETRIKGVPLSRLNVPNEIFPKICENVFLFWHDVQFHSGAVVDIDQKKFDQIFQQPLRQLAEWAKLSRQYEEILRRLEDFFGEHFNAQRLFMGLIHGDYSTKNILADPKTFQFSGIIDWDLAERESFPLLDVLHFFVRLDSNSFLEAPPRIAMRLIQPNPTALHRLYFQKALAKFDYEEKFLPAIAAYYWLQRLRVYFDSPKFLDAHFMRRQVYDILDFFNETILARKISGNKIN
jgi:hypothetical protein